MQEAKRRLVEYKRSGAFAGPSGADFMNEDVCLQAIALTADGSPVNIMHSDGGKQMSRIPTVSYQCFLTPLSAHVGFRLLLLPHLINSTNPNCVSQHLLAINALADSILRTFPAGLFTPVGVLIANPAFSTDPTHAKVFTTGAYHGTVVWSWNSLVLLAKGLEVQLIAMASAESASTKTATMSPDSTNLCSEVHAKLKKSYSKVWDTIESSKEHSMAEVWSWHWKESSSAADGSHDPGGFQYVPLNHLATPNGEGQTESNAIQLWSLAILALTRRKELEV